VPDGDGTRLVTRDRSCTNPAIPQAGLALSNASYASGDDGAGTGVERTREGHFEVIEMATLPPSLIAAVNPSNGLLDCTPLQGATPNLEPRGPGGA